MKKQIALIASILVLVSLCSAASKKNSKVMPAWITEPYSVYSDTKYLVAVGSDLERTSAEVKACSNIASIFNHTINDKTIAHSRISQEQLDGVASNSRNSSLNQKVEKLVKSENLMAVEIKEAWFSKQENQWYCLAVLDRAKACKIYQQQIQLNEKKIQELISYETDDEYSFETFERLTFAHQIALLNEIYFSRVSVIDSSFAKMIQMTSSQVLLLAKERIASQIPICVLVEGDVDSRIETAFEKVFASLGFKTSSDANERYVFNVKASMQGVPTSDGKTVRCIYSVTADLCDQFFYKEHLPFSISGRKSDLNFIKAQEKSLKLIEKTIDEDFALSFIEYFNKNRGM